MSADLGNSPLVRKDSVTCQQPPLCVLSAVNMSKCTSLGFPQPQPCSPPSRHSSAGCHHLLPHWGSFGVHILFNMHDQCLCSARHIVNSRSIWLGAQALEPDSLGLNSTLSFISYKLSEPQFPYLQHVEYPLCACVHIQLCMLNEIIKVHLLAQCWSYLLYQKSANYFHQGSDSKYLLYRVR